MFKHPVQPSFSYFIIFLFRWLVLPVDGIRHAVYTFIRQEILARAHTLQFGPLLETAISPHEAEQHR
jgi:hypothetical protein